MTPIATTPLQGITSADLSSAAFCEACERLIAVRALLEDPRHQTKRQGAALTAVLREGLASVSGRLRDVATLALAQDERECRSALAGIGAALAGLRQIHANLGYLGTRWPLGTADLFVRKLVAEGIPSPIPTLLVTEAYDDVGGELGEALQAQLRDIGLAPSRPRSASPLIAVPTADLLDPLSWPALLLPLGGAIVDTLGIAAGLRSPSRHMDDEDRYRRACVACVAARLLGEPTYAACAVRTLLLRLSGTQRSPDLSLLAGYTLAAVQIPGGGLAAQYQALLQVQQEGSYGWGHARTPGDDEPDALTSYPEIVELVATRLPRTALAGEATLDLLCDQLADGRPINASPPRLPEQFARQLAEGVDAERFYAVLAQAGEEPNSLATILAAGWRYKRRRSYPLCRELLGGPANWEAGLEAFAGHVLERGALLAQSMEAAYVQQVFTRWRDQ